MTDYKKRIEDRIRELDEGIKKGKKDMMGVEKYCDYEIKAIAEGIYLNSSIKYELKHLLEEG